MAAARAGSRTPGDGGGWTRPTCSQRARDTPAPAGGAEGALKGEGGGDGAAELVTIGSDEGA